MSQRDQKIAQLQEQITAKAEQLATSDGWQAMLDTAAKFPTYSLGNQIALAVEAERRGFTPTRVCGYRTWQSLGRQVRRGERGIPILAPVRKRTEAADVEATEGDEGGGWRIVGFKMEHVWDISQTDGEPLPDTGPRLLAGDGSPVVKQGVEEMIKAAGYSIEYGEPPAGANGLTDMAAKTVIVRDDVHDLQQLKTLIHELAHVGMHAGQQPDDVHLRRGRAEVEAESVAYVVLGAIGHDTSDYTIPYVTGWARGDPDQIRAAAEAVTTQARTILDQLDRDDPESASAEPGTREAEADRARNTDRGVVEPAQPSHEPNTGPTTHADDMATSHQSAEPTNHRNELDATPAAGAKPVDEVSGRSEPLTTGDALTRARRALDQLDRRQTTDQHLQHPAREPAHTARHVVGD